jgi:hypothetical protein
MTLRMTGSRYPPLGGVSLGKLLISDGFGTSARKPENGFTPGRIVSSLARRRNIRLGNASNFKGRKIGGMRLAHLFPQAAGEGTNSGLVADR